MVGKLTLQVTLFPRNHILSDGLTASTRLL